MQGQMFSIERDLIHQSVLENKPQNVYECGTWYGGGSTYYIATALYKNRNGHLNTFEIDLGVLQTAIKDYSIEAPHLLPYITFNHFDCKQYLEGHKPQIDFFLSDGPDEPTYTLSLIQLVEKLIVPGGILVLHDWKDKATREDGSFVMNVVKCQLAKPYLLSSPNWKVERIIDSTGTGMAKFSRK